MRTKQLAIAIELRHERHSRRARFDGYAYTDAGFLSGNITTNTHQSFSKAELVLLTAFTLTGCPIAARRAGEVLNPWQLTAGSYRGKRSLRSDTFTATSRIVAVSNGDRVDMDLQLSYDGHLPSLSGITQPFQERIEQISRGSLRGFFEVPFDLERGETVVARSDSEYELDVEVDVASSWRNITILPVLGHNRLSQIEQIDLFGSLTEATEDLIEKVRCASEHRSGARLGLIGA